MFGFIDAWWQALILVGSITGGVSLMAWVLMGLVGTVSRNRASLTIGVGRAGTLKLGTSNQNTMVDLQAPTFDHKNWNELLLRFNKVIHAAYRKGQIIYKEIPESLSVPLEKARSGIFRLYEHQYLSMLAEECRNVENRSTVPTNPYDTVFDSDGCIEDLDRRVLSNSRDVRDFKFVLNEAVDDILNYTRFLFSESDLISDEAVFNRYLDDEVIAIVGKFDSEMNDHYYDRSMVQPTTLYRKTRDCVPQLGRIIETLLRRGRQLVLDKMSEIETIDQELKNYGVELKDS